MTYQPYMYLAAEEYDRDCHLQLKYATELMKEYVKRFDNKVRGRIMDVGCGTGRVTIDILRKYAERDSQIDACDISKEVIQYATAMYPETYVFQHDVSTDFPENLQECYDFVFSNCMMHWVKNQRAALKNIKTLLKPGGKIAMSLIGYHPAFDIYREMAQEKTWAKHLIDVENFIPPYQDMNDIKGTFERNMTEAGFRNIHVILAPFVDHSKLKDQSIEFLKATIRNSDALYPKIPENEKNSYLNTILEKLISRGYFEGGSQDTKKYGHLILAMGEK